MFHSRTKHIGVHYNFTKDLVVNREIQIEYVPTELMVADIFTKALDREKHIRFSSMMGLLPLSMIKSRVRGCVEQSVSANLCVLSTRPYPEVSQMLSQETSKVQSCELDIDDNCLHRVQAYEHEKHVRAALKNRRQQKTKRKVVNKSKCPSEERKEKIDANARAMEIDMRKAIVKNNKKRKSKDDTNTVSKRRRVTMGKYCVKRVESACEKSILRCFDRRGGKRGRAHTHQWWARV